MAALLWQPCTTIIFSEVVDRSRRRRRLGASPECHLAPVRPVKHIPFDTGSRLSLLAIGFASRFMNSGNSFLVL